MIDVIEHELNEMLKFWGDERGLCLKCQHRLEESQKAGYVIRTDQEYNECPYASDMMYHGDDHDEWQYIAPDVEICDGNNRRYELHGVVIFETVDNGMGYDIVMCPYFQERKLPVKRLYEAAMDKMLDYTDSLIERGVSPDCAADNAGYVLYAALGGQARQEHRIININNKAEQPEETA